MPKPSLTQILTNSDATVVVPCVYDAASARAVEMVGFSAMLFSSGEFSAASAGLFDRGFNGLTDVEWMVGRITLTSPLPMIVDIEDGYGGPLAVYRNCKRMVRAGASAVQLEDGRSGEDPLSLLPRDEYLAKVKAALAAIADSDCILIARTNADTVTQLDEAVARCVAAYELGAQMTTVVRLSNIEDARYVAERVPGWKMYPDAAGHGGRPEITVDQARELGFRIITMHYLLKAAMDGMLEHGRQNFARQDCLYTYEKKDATGILGESATPLFEPDAFLEFEAKFTGIHRKFRIGDHEMKEFPEGFVRTPVQERF